MGDVSIVRGDNDGKVRAVKMLAGGDIEEGDLVAFHSEDGEIIKVASDDKDPIGVALESFDDTEYGIVGLIRPGTIVEGTTASNSGLLQGDEVGLVVDGSSGAITFDEDGSNIAGYVYKVLSTTRAQVSMIATGQKI